MAGGDGREGVRVSAQGRGSRMVGEMVGGECVGLPGPGRGRGKKAWDSGEAGGSGREGVKDDQSSVLVFPHSPENNLSQEKTRVWTSKGWSGTG